MELKVLAYFLYCLVQIRVLKSIWEQVKIKDFTLIINLILLLFFFRSYIWCSTTSKLKVFDWESQKKISDSKCFQIQEILTKDSVTITVDAVCYFRVVNPVSSVTSVSNAQYSTRSLAATTLRNILGTRTLQEILQEKENIAHNMQVGVSFLGLDLEEILQKMVYFRKYSIMRLRTGELK